MASGESFQQPLSHDGNVRLCSSHKKLVGSFWIVALTTLTYQIGYALIRVNTEARYAGFKTTKNT